ncbi:MAG: tryptophan synthase subunit alpha, partial [Microlunatus sp.]|nr:tryptophan synthase subunit alpha [Microlunatus sp.]
PSSGTRSGVIRPDPTAAARDAHGLDRVLLIAPSSTSERLVTTTAACRGFVYAASLMGVTGTRDAVGGEAATLVGRAREVTDTPICVGLGVSTGEQAREVAGFADGVIVGSALVGTLVNATDRQDGLDALAEKAASLAEGVRG